MPHDRSAARSTLASMARMDAVVPKRPSVRRTARPFLSLTVLTVLIALAALTTSLARPVAPTAATPQRVAAAQPATTAPRVEGHLLTRRWVYIQANFQAADTPARVEGILERAAAAGYNGAVFADVKFGRLEDGSLIPAYFDNLDRVLRRAVALGMAVRPASADFGYSESILWHDPNLAEGLPVHGEPYRAVLDGADGPGTGHLAPLDEPPVTLANGDFEQLPASGDTFPGWAFQDAPGVATFVDQGVRHGGRASLRMTDLATTNPGSGNGRVYQRLAVEPFRHYHLRVWVRTAGFRGGEVRFLVLGQNPDRTLQHNPVPVAATQDWTRFDVTFNTLTHREVLVYLGVWGGGSGTIWWDDALIEPAGPVNLVRRPGAPLALTDDAGTLAYDEGRDIAPISDPLAGTTPWPGSFDLWHAPPALRIPAGSRIEGGQVVRLSYYHAALIHGDQVAASLLEPAALDIVTAQLANLQRAFARAGAFSGWHFGHDEIRVHGWDQAPHAGVGTPGEDLAENVRLLTARAAALAPEGEVTVWSDMFDPNHNAAPGPPYYLVDGDWSGSWLGLLPAVSILNWHSFQPERRAAAEHFAARGHRQILAGYYDSAPAAFRDRAWLAELAGVSGVDGVMYTQWGSGYANLEAWAAHIWGDATWEAVPGPTTAPTAANPTTVPTIVPTTDATALPTATATRTSATAVSTAAPSASPPTAGPPAGALFIPRAESPLRRP